ncbi:MAG TPA: MFS transporter [Acidimicrobiales bacterium]|nr:MFS transporter [Acidimicrobiales bacterium]
MTSATPPAEPTWGADRAGLDRRWWTLIAVCGATFMLLVDVTIVQVALPTMQRELHASFAQLEWVISAYALSLAALLLTQGTLADRFGRKRIFAVGLTIFTLASLVCGLADSATFLIVGRAVQGVGGAAMFATSLALIGQDFRGKDRGTAIAAWGATVGGAVAVGPLAGGALTSGLGWRWIFFVNVPIGIATLAVSLTRMVNISDPGTKRLDVAGLATFSGALFLLIFGLTRGNDDGWSSVFILTLFGSAAVLFAAFVFAEFHQDRPMFDLSLFRKPAFTGVSLATFALGAGMFAMLTYLTLYLQDLLGLSPFQGGLRLLPLTVLCFVVPLATRRLGEHTPPGLALGTGLLLSAVGLALMHGVTATSSWTRLLPGLIVSGLGIGVANPAIAKIALGVVSPERSGMASGISNTFRIGGLATGVAGLGALFQGRIASSLTSVLGHPAGMLSTAVAAEGTRGADRRTLVGAHLTQAAGHAFSIGINDLLITGAAVVFIGAFFSILVRRRDFPAPLPVPPVDSSPDAEPELLVDATP